MLRNNKGITLIVLIITVTVLLILATVSIDFVVGDGMFDKAGNEVSKTNSKIAQQQETMNILKGELQEIEREQISEGENEQIGGENGGNTAGGGATGGDQTGGGEDGGNQTGEHSWTRSGDVITCSHCDKTYTIGDVVNYTEGGQASTSISEGKSGIAQAKTNGKSWASSYGTEQTLSKDANTVWVVLGIEDSNKDGNSETLLLTTQMPTTGTIVLYGEAAYNNGIEELNRMCKELYGEKARGMTIEDVNNCLEYNPAGGGYSSSGIYYTTENFTTKLSDLWIWSNIQTNLGGTYYTPEYPAGTTDASKLGKYLLDGYEYYLSDDEIYIVDPADSTNTSHTITPSTRNLIFGNTNNYNYWLASRGVGANPVDGGCFGIGAVVGKRGHACLCTFFSTGMRLAFNVAVRAVVPL